MLARSVSDESKGQSAVVPAPFGPALRCLQYLALLIIDGDGEQLAYLAQKLRHLIPGQFQRAVEINAIKHWRRATVLRPSR
jgi:hypothetical protein